MQLNKAKLTSGDQTEWLKLARGIRLSRLLNKAEHPVASQFFDSDPSGVRQLDTEALVTSLAGEPFNQRDRQIEDSAFQQAVRDQDSRLAGVSKPQLAGDVALIGSGRSGWKGPPIPGTSFDGKAERTQKVAKAANPSVADSTILVETLKSIVHQLLGVNVESVDPGVLKSKLATTIKSRPDLGKRLAKTLGIASPVPDEAVSANGWSSPGPGRTRFAL